MDVYLEPLIDELLKLWVIISMYYISKPIRQNHFLFHGIHTWTIHDAASLIHFCGMYFFHVYCLCIIYYSTSFMIFGILLMVFYNMYGLKQRENMPIQYVVQESYLVIQYV